ncbi:MAG: TonB-dependent receptor [Sphingomicrobium sp.]
MKLDYRQRLLATTLLVGASVLATPAIAQDVPPTDGSPTDLTNPSGPVEAQPTPSTSAEGEPVEQAQDIVVTGSRIPQPNLEAQAPVTVVTNQDIKLSGATRIEDLLNSLPSVSAEQASGVSNGASGTATVDLRGLGSKRTLVLVNGRRLVPGDPFTPSSADLNFIPSSIIKRVEVLTGGASSTYGADAVAGVVNFIMDTNFSGIRFDGQYGVYQHSNGNKVLPDLLDLRANSGFAGFGYPKGSVVDGGAFDGTVSIGTGFDDNRGHAVAYFGYRKVRPVTQDRRDYSACVLQVNDSLGDSDGDGQGFDRAGRPNQCGGSLTNRTGTGIFYLPYDPDGDGVAVATSYIGLLGAGGTFEVGAVDRFNFAPTNYFQRPDERYTAGVFANYEISDQIKPYMEFMFMDDRSLAQIAPSGNFGNTLTINCDNPLLSAEQLGIICQGTANNAFGAGGSINVGPDFNLVSGFLGTFPLVVGQTGDAPLEFVDTTRPGVTYNRAFFQLLRRNVEGGPRIADLQHTAFRGVLGTRGDLSKVWSYDAYFQYGRMNYQQTYSNEFSIARITRALDVVDDPRTPGVVDPICRSAVDGSDPLCVPFDIFTGAPVSAAARGYLAAQGFARGQTSEQIANVNFTGLLGEMGFKSPYANDGIAVNFGAEYRKESLELQTDNAFQTGDLSGQGAPTLPVSGDYRVLEAFAEAQIPIIQEGLVEDLSINLGYRKSYYKLSNGRTYDTDTYKIGAEFAPIKDIRFRAAYNRAARAPNIQELFATRFVGLDGATDPCAGRPLTAADFGCLAQLALVNPGSTPANFIGRNIAVNPAGQYNGLLGGTPTLNPETGTTKTIGVVLKPRFLPRLAVTVDYFDIDLKDAIQGFGADAILAQCIAGTTAATVDPSCALVRRNPVSGSIWLSPDGFVIDVPSNVGGVTIKGFEFNGAYSHRLANIGTLSASIIGTRLKSFKTDNGLTEIYDCAGFFGPICSGGTTTSSAPQPKWRHKARLSLAMPSGVGASVAWRRVGKVASEYTSPSSTLSGNGNSYEFGERIKAQNYFDLAGTFTFGDHYNFRLGVNNVLDRDPPLVHSGSGNFGFNLCPVGSCNGNTFPGTYDSLGRYLYAGITLDF